MPQVATHADLPFYDLSASAFEELVLHLMIRVPKFEAVERIGGAGRDYGIDIVARTRRDQRNVIVQVKRTISLSSVQITQELAKIRKLPAQEKPYLYILATSATPSAAATLTFRDGCRKARIQKHELWNRSVLTAKLLSFPDLIEYFFGTNYYDQFIALREPNRQALNHLCQQALRDGVVLIIGRSGEFAPDYPSMTDVDTAIKAILESAEDRLALGDELSEISLPLQDLLHRSSDSVSYRRQRTQLYQLVDHSQTFRELLLQHLAKGNRAHIPGMVRTIANLMSRSIIRGVVQLQPQPTLARVIKLSPNLQAHLYAGDDMVQRTPFVLDLGLDKAGLPRLAIGSSDLANALSAGLQDFGTRPPVFVAVNLADIDSPLITALVSTAAKESQVFVLGTNPPPIRARTGRVKEQPSRFLSLLDENSASVPLTGYCRRIDFSGPPSLERIIYSAKLRPEDVKVAKPPLLLQKGVDSLIADKLLLISAYSGSGKSTRAFFIARELETLGYAVYYLPCEELGETIPLSRDLTSLCTALAVNEPKCALILDDFHLIKNHCDNFDKWVSQTRDAGRPLIIKIESLPFMSEQVIGGKIVLFPVREMSREGLEYDWPEEREDLFQWLQERKEELSLSGIRPTAPEKDQMAEAQNIWHFFYLLRGGANTLARELDEARSLVRANTVWFVVCLRYFLKQTSCTVDDIVSAIRADKLSPAEIDTGNVGPWVSECLKQLVSHQMLVPVDGGVTPRHRLEAASVIRICLGNTAETELERFRRAALRMVKRKIPPLKLSEEVRTALHSGTKYEVYVAIGQHLKPTIEQIVKLQFALVPWPALQDYFDEVWADLLSVLENADIHHLYWIFNRVWFSGGSLRFAPWDRIKSIKAFTVLNTVSDAVDFSVVINGLVARDSINEADILYRHKRGLANIQALAAQQGSASLYVLSRLQHEVLWKIDSTAAASLKNPKELRDSMTTLFLDAVSQMANDETESTEADKADIRSKRVIQSLLAISKKAEISLAKKLPAIIKEYEDKAKDSHLDVGLPTARDAAYFLASIMHAQAALSSMFDQISTKTMVQNLKKVGYGAGVLAFAHLWLASPDKAGDVFSAMPKRMVSFLENKVIRGDSYSDFHIGRDTALFQVFVKWLTERSEKIATYYRDRFMLDESGRQIDQDMNSAGEYLHEVATFAVPQLLTDDNLP